MATYVQGMTRPHKAATYVKSSSAIVDNLIISVSLEFKAQLHVTFDKAQ